MMKRFLWRALVVLLFSCLCFFVINDRLDRLFAQEQKDSKSGAKVVLEGGWIDVQKIASVKETGRVVEHELFFLLTGLDQNEGNTSDTSRSDTMMLVKMDFDKHTVDILSLPRDSRVLVEGEYTKLNHSHSYGGVDLTIKTIRDWLNIDLDYYVEVSFEAVQSLVDAIGGVEYTIPSDIAIDYYVPGKGDISIPSGKQILNGEQALGYLRFRKGYENGDLGRVEAQQEFIKALAQQIMRPEHITKLPSFVKTYFDTVHTNIPLNQIIGIATQMSGMSDLKVYTHTLPGEGKYIDDISYYVVDEEEAKALVHEVLPNYEISPDAFLENTEEDTGAQSEER